MLKCPKCKSDAVKKYGIISTGKQRYCCKDCGAQFVENPENKPYLFLKEWGFKDCNEEGIHYIRLAQSALENMDYIRAKEFISYIAQDQCHPKILNEKNRI